MVLENCIPERLLSMPRLSDGNTVGWSGFTPTHPGDLRATGGGVAEVVRKGARYLQVGPATGVKEQLCLDGYPEATGALPNIEDYYMALGRLDVGICPLLDTEFNHAKSWLKPLEMAARGVVPVMSPVREYAGIHEEGDRAAGGYRGREWAREITRLLSNEPLRQEMARTVTRSRPGGRSRGTPSIGSRHGSRPSRTATPRASRWRHDLLPLPQASERTGRVLESPDRVHPSLLLAEDAGRMRGAIILGGNGALRVPAERWLIRGSTPDWRKHGKQHRGLLRSHGCRAAGCSAVMEVAHWYHIFGSGHWREAVAEHMAALEDAKFDGSSASASWAIRRRNESRCGRTGSPAPT